jgi:hypothetical protein
MYGLATYDAVAAATVNAGAVRTAVEAAGLDVPERVFVGVAPQTTGSDPILVLGDDTEALAPGWADKRGLPTDVTTTAVSWASTLRKARLIAEAWGRTLLANVPTVTGARIVRAALDLSVPVGQTPDPNAPPAFGWAVRLRFTLDPTS